MRSTGRVETFSRVMRIVDLQNWVNATTKAPEMEVILTFRRYIASQRHGLMMSDVCGEEVVLERQHTR